VVGLTQDGGFWLVHSIPQFPQFVANGNYPGYDAAPDYGQSMLCMTLNFNDFNSIGLQFTYNYPYYYDWNMPSWVPSYLLKAVTASNHTTAKISRLTNLGTFPSFISFAKTSSWNDALYENLVAPTLNSDLYVETWMNGQGTPLPSLCQKATIPYNIMNVRTLSLAQINWTETNDHSKWAITTDSGLQYVCIGDINRMQSQNTRAGGTVCFVNSALWNSFTTTITSRDFCPNTTLGIISSSSSMTSSSAMTSSSSMTSSSIVSSSAPGTDSSSSTGTHSTGGTMEQTLVVATVVAIAHIVLQFLANVQ